eukprot:s4958_g2.t1
MHMAFDGFGPSNFYRGRGETGEGAQQADSGGRQLQWPPGSLKSTASASSFLFDAEAPKSSERLSAATEAAVQDIASEILGAEEGTMTRPPSLASKPLGLAVERVAAVASCPPDPWASSDSESSQKEESEQPALQDAPAVSMSSTAQSSVPSAEPEVELEPPGSKSVLKAARLHRALLKVQTNASQGKFAEVRESSVWVCLKIIED